MQFPLGSSVREGIANGATPFQEDDRYTLGLVMARERGVPDVAVLIEALQQDQKLFGKHIGGAYGSYVVEQLFANAGEFGARFYGVRKVGAGSAAATFAVTFTLGEVDATITSQDIVLPAASQYAKRNLYFNNVSVGDSFTVAGVTHVATIASPLHVATELAAKLMADAAFAAAHSARANGHVLEITANAPNVAIAAVTSVVAVVNAAGTALFTVHAGQKGMQDPGTWGNQLSLKIYAFGALQAGNFAIEVYLSGERKEVWTGGTMAEIVNTINGSSEYIVISNYAGTHAPTATANILLAGGVYNAPAVEAEYYPVSDAISPKGFGAFDGKDVSVIAQTEIFTNTMAAQTRDYALRNRKIGVQTLPYLASEATADAFSNTLQTYSVISRHILIYDSWDEVSDGVGGWKWVPALGRILGAGFLRVPQMNNNQIWFSPAGLDSIGVGFRNTTPSYTPQSPLVDTYARKKTINTTVTQKGTGSFFMSARTMSTHPFFMSAHISRLTNFLLNTLEKSFLKVIGKPNTPELRASIVTEITQYFKTLYDEGALERSIPFDKAFKCICNQSNNPLGADRKQLQVDIYWIPAECIEAIQINLNRNDGTLIASIVDLAAA